MLHSSSYLQFQDISAFSEENFDTKEWINNTLKNLDNQDKKEVPTVQGVHKNYLTEPCFRTIQCRW